MEGIFDFAGVQRQQYNYAQVPILDVANLCSEALIRSIMFVHNVRQESSISQGSR